jgi:hypothetical protein
LTRNVGRSGRGSGSALVPGLLLLLGLGGAFGQLVAMRDAGLHPLLFAGLRLAPPALLVASAVGMLYGARGCLPVAMLCLLAIVGGDVALLLLGRSGGLGAGTLVAAAVLVGVAARRALRPRGDAARAEGAEG